MIGPNTLLSGAFSGIANLNLGFGAALLCGALASGVVSTAVYFGDLSVQSTAGGTLEKRPVIASVENSKPITARPTASKEKPAGLAAKEQNILDREREETRKKRLAAQKASELATAERASKAEQKSLPAPNDDIGLMIAGFDRSGDVDDLLKALDNLPDTGPVRNTSSAIEELTKRDPAPLPTKDNATNQSSELDRLVASLALETLANNSQPASSNQIEEQKPEASALPSVGQAVGSKLSERLAAGALAVSSQSGAGATKWNGRFPSLTKTQGRGQIIAQGGLPVANPQAGRLATLPRANTTALPTNNSGQAGPRSFIMSNAPATTSTPTISPQASPQVLQPPALTGDALAQAVTAYGQGVSERIRASIAYPKSLEPQRVEGTVELGLVFNTTGQLTQVVTINSSQNRIIDESAIATVRNIRFPVPPVGATPQQLRFGIKMTYTPPIPTAAGGATSG